MKKPTLSRPSVASIRLNNKDIPVAPVYFTGNAISSWSSRLDGVITGLDQCIWHEDRTSGTLRYIVTYMKV